MYSYLQNMKSPLILQADKVILSLYDGNVPSIDVFRNQLNYYLCH